MVIPEPQLSHRLLALVDRSVENDRDRPIQTKYKGFDCYFVMFHPFVLIMNDQRAESRIDSNALSVQVRKRESCRRLSWTEFIEISGITHYIDVDESLAFWHRARSLAKKSEYLKFRKTMAEHVPQLIPPSVDQFPEILEAELFEYLLRVEYAKVYIYSDFDEKSGLTNINELLQMESELPSHVRIETPNRELLIAQDFDQRFSYICGSHTTVNALVRDLGLEGFYCGQNTPEWWSYRAIPARESIVLSGL